MLLGWRERLNLQPEWADMNHWPWIDPGSLPLSKRNQYVRNREAITCVLRGESMKNVAQQLGFHASALTRLAHRCLGGRDDELPHLSQALIPGKRIEHSHRHKPLGKVGECVGAANAFNHLLDTVPGLQPYLDKLIKGSVKQSRHGQNLTPKAFHAAFIRYLRGINWPQDTYPFSVSSQGYETLRQYLKQQVLILSIPTEAKRVILPKSITNQYAREIEIDEHTVDSHSSISLAFNGELEHLRVSRIYLLAARDVATGCTLAYTLSLSPAPTADDVLNLLKQLTSRWKPLELKTPGLTYPPGDCFPSALGEAYQRALINIIRMDNAWAHLALNVRQFVCKSLGATLNLGIVKTPKARNIIEQAFAKLNIDIHRLPSTTGSHTQDPVKEPPQHYKKAPTVSLRVLEEAISVVLAEHNRRVVGNIGGTTPISQVQYQMAQHFIPMRPGVIDPLLTSRDQEEIAYVRQYKDHSPCINFEGVRYRGRGIDQPELINSQVKIRFDTDDIRQLQVTTLDGKSLGAVLAAKTWQRFSHSRTTRKYIMKMIKKGFIERRDPFGNYFDYMAKHRHLPTKALEMVRVHREFSRPTKPNVTLKDITEHKSLDDDSKQKNKNIKIPVWSPSMVEKRR